MVADQAHPHLQAHRHQEDFRQHQSLQMLLAAHPVQCGSQISRLLPSPKNDLNLLTLAIDFTKLLHALHLLFHVGRHQMPTIADSVFLAHGLSFCFRLGVALTTRFWASCLLTLTATSRARWLFELMLTARSSRLAVVCWRTFSSSRSTSSP
jgi:hypothetical protein